MADDLSDRILDSPLGSAGEYVGVEQLFELTPDRVGQTSVAADNSSAQVDRSPSLSVIKELPKVVALQASPPSVVSVSQLSPTGRQAPEPQSSRGLIWSAGEEEEFARFKA